MSKTEKYTMFVLVFLIVIFSAILSCSITRLINISEQTLKNSQPEAIKVIPDKYVLEDK